MIDDCRLKIRVRKTLVRPNLQSSIFNHRFWRVAAISLFTARVLAAQTITPSDDRQADLTRLQKRIGNLKAALADSEKKAATLAEERKRLELKLEIATREDELIAATREEFSRRREAVARESASASAAA